jgi:hypothetical protein
MADKYIWRDVNDPDTVAVGIPIKINGKYHVMTMMNTRIDHLDDLFGYDFGTRVRREEPGKILLFNVTATIKECTE